MKTAPFYQLLSMEAPPSPLSSRPERSVVERSLCGCFVLEMNHEPAGPPRVMKQLCSATTLPGSAALPFVISTGAKRSGEISVWTLCPGNESWTSGPTQGDETALFSNDSPRKRRPPLCHLDRSEA